MNALMKLTFFSTVLALVGTPQLVQAQVRDAAAKARGDYSFFARESNVAAQPRVYRAPVTSAVPQAVSPTQSRSYSYSAANSEPSCAAEQPQTMPAHADMPSMTQRPTTEERRFSYESAAPTFNRPAPAARPSGVRNAASKVLGQY